jgi:hypothetical protein
MNGDRPQTVAVPISLTSHGPAWQPTCDVLPGGKEVRHVVHGPDIGVS